MHLKGPASQSAHNLTYSYLPWQPVLKVLRRHDSYMNAALRAKCETGTFHSFGTLLRLTLETMFADLHEFLDQTFENIISTTGFSE